MKKLVARRIGACNLCLPHMPAAYHLESQEHIDGCNNVMVYSNVSLTKGKLSIFCYANGWDFD